MRLPAMSLLLLLIAATGPAAADDRLVLDVDADRDLLSLTHNIDPFPFRPTMNFSPDLAGDLAGRMRVPELEHMLAVTVTVRIDGEIAGLATEQEIVVPDPAGGKPSVQSAWLIMLRHPKANGFLAVAQRENAGATFELIRKIGADPEAYANDHETRSFLSTDGPTYVSTAGGGLEAYRGGRFEEYNLVTPSDLARKGRFPARLRFVIYPGAEGASR
jgi:hypothetical protein